MDPTTTRAKPNRLVTVGDHSTEDAARILGLEVGELRILAKYGYARPLQAAPRCWRWTVGELARLRSEIQRQTAPDFVRAVRTPTSVARLSASVYSRAPNGCCLADAFDESAVSDADLRCVLARAQGERHKDCAELARVLLSLPMRSRVNVCHAHRREQAPAEVEAVC